MKKTILSVLILITLLLSSCTVYERGDELSVHFIDVGQADCILVLLPGGKNMLIDAGNRSDGGAVAAYLSKYGVTTVDYLIGTHPHADHIGGLDTIIKEFDIGQIYMPRISADTKTFEDVLTAIKNKNLTVSTAKAGVNVLDGDGVRIDIVAPNSDNYTDTNDYSAVIKLTYGRRAFLFAGDAHKLSETEITASLSADVLKVGHHGSSSSTTDTFLRRVNPYYAVICVGEKNSYNHPHESTLNRLNEVCSEIYRTDLHGDIVFSTDGVSISVHTEK